MSIFSTIIWLFTICNYSIWISEIQLVPFVCDYSNWCQKTEGNFYWICRRSLYGAVCVSHAYYNCSVRFFFLAQTHRKNATPSFQLSVHQATSRSCLLYADGNVEKINKYTREPSASESELVFECSRLSCSGIVRWTVFIPHIHTYSVDVLSRLTAAYLTLE